MEFVFAVEREDELNHSITWITVHLPDQKEVTY